MEVNTDGEIHSDGRSLYTLQWALNVSGNRGHFFGSTLKVIVVTICLEDFVHAGPTSWP